MVLNQNCISQIIYSAYRYTYNGMEADHEVSGHGNSYTTQFRQYDPRLGRWKSLDPLAGKYPDQSPFAAFNNNPIYFTDPLGLEGEGSNEGGPEGSGTKSDPYKVEGKYDSGYKVLDDIGTPTDGETVYFTNGKTSLKATYNEKKGAWETAWGSSNAKESTWKKGGDYKATTKPNSSVPPVANTGSSNSTGSDNGSAKVQINTNPSGGNKNQNLTATNNQSTINFSSISKEYDNIVINQPPSTDIKISNGNNDNGTSTVLTIGGVSYSVLEYLTYNEELGYWLGKNGKYYSIDWGGNQWTGGRNAVVETSKNFKAAGRVVFFVSTAISVGGLVEGIVEGNSDQIINSSADIICGAAMTYGGPIGFVIGGVGMLAGWATEKGYISSGDASVNSDGSSIYGNSGTTCFVAGTKVLMCDGSQKNIEDVFAGEAILSVDFKTMTIESDTVLLIPDKVNQYNIIQAHFENGTINKFSPSHPFWVVGKGWCVYNVEEAKDELNFIVGQLEVGDVVLYFSGGDLLETKIVSIYDTQIKVDMYNLEFVKKNNCFFANGILVHNKYEEE